MSLEKTWQSFMNYALDSSSVANTGKNALWFIKAFLTGQVGGAKNVQGLWTLDSSCDGTTAGTAGDGVDRWGTVGSSAGGSGTTASFSSGATIPGAVRMTGLTGMTSGDVGNFFTISNGASAVNNGTFKIVHFVSSTSVDVYNPSAVVGDTNNGSIHWAEVGSWTFDASKIVNAAAGTAHSWAVLKSPAALGPVYMVLEAGSAPYLACFTLSKTQPSGGTTSNRPTASDELTGPAWRDTFIFSNGGTAKMHGSIATDGNWHTMVSQDGDTKIYSFQTFQILADTHATDTAPYFAFFQNSNSNPVTRTNLQTGQGAMRTTDNKLSIGPGAGSSIYMQPLYWIQDDSANWIESMTADFTDSAYDDLPIYWVAAYGQRSIRGRWIDYRWCSPNLANNSFEPASGTVESIAMGNIWIPADAAIVF